jgi:hypothetical protein
LVIFLCNHCPYVKHIGDVLADLCGEYMKRGVAVVGINSNDFVAHPEDHPDKMAQATRQLGYPFPYLIDEDQSVAKAYRAACTPDFFLYDAKRALAYRGQMDASRPGNSVPVTGADLRRAMESVLAGKAVAGRQLPSMGCNIKWKAGNAPDYFASAG